MLASALSNGRIVPVTQISRPRPMLRETLEEWDQMIDVNIKGVLYGIAAALPHMQKQKSGQIINVSSVAGHKAALAARSMPAPNGLCEPSRRACARKSSPAGMKQVYEAAIPASSYARVVEFAMSQPEDVDLNEVLFRPTSQAY